MPTPPLPASPCLRVRLIYTASGALLAGNRLYFSYTGSAPTGAECITLAGDVAAAWNTHVAPVVNSNFALEEVDVLDIATDSGFSGQWTGSHGGTDANGTSLPVGCATNVEFDIARRYRGGKPRMYLPPGCSGDQATDATYGTTFITAVNTAVAAFIAAIDGASVGVGTLAHVLLSYYHGYNTASPPWRGPGYKYPPKYKDAATLDTVVGYSTKAVIGTQKRRRTSTTP